MTRFSFASTWQGLDLHPHPLQRQLFQRLKSNIHLWSLQILHEQTHAFTLAFGFAFENEMRTRYCDQPLPPASCCELHVGKRLLDLGRRERVLGVFRVHPPVEARLSLYSLGQLACMSE
ncbi:uncharacterized protein APUU_80046S [Aspergillus puulaauensis]|uniref:Uncharacterized protein n=1 Tax=Aspergillus puulaauensis TaxID=1220207 RepID=A0A7R7XZD0_9EURO|nr:uncharacterized protein APUU_80046S [Aspergillus puulaauensis]BCS29743.1 hypothetical protein APUU_80046S [Aspergillus puulaauensis]